MNILQEIKKSISLDIDQDYLSDLIFDEAVDKALIKLTELVPTKLDDNFYAMKKPELRELFKKEFSKQVLKAEDAVNGEKLV